MDSSCQVCCHFLSSVVLPLVFQVRQVFQQQILSVFVDFGIYFKFIFEGQYVIYLEFLVDFFLQHFEYVIPLPYVTTIHDERTTVNSVVLYI